MEPISTPPPLFGASNTATSTQGAEDLNTLSSDFDTFLKMLTVQVQNQDPLNPVDSTDYATQLATFSSVEQQVLSNDLLRGISDQLAGSALQQMGSWIGMEALTQAPVYFEAEPVTVRPVFAEGAERADLVVTNALGIEVDRLPLDPDRDSVLWTGVDASQQPLPEGAYSFSVESFAQSDLIDRSTPHTYARIDEVRSEASGLVLVLANGSKVAAQDVTGLRTPD